MPRMPTIIHKNPLPVNELTMLELGLWLSQAPPSNDEWVDYTLGRGA